MIEDLLNRPDKFRYMMLNRMQCDCEYFLGYGNRYEGNLWAQSVEKQISYMRALYDSFEEKPVWCTKEQIDEYERKMLEK